MQIKTKLLKCPQVLFRTQECVYMHMRAHTYNQWQKNPEKPFLKAIYFLFLTLKKPFFLFLRVISPAGSCELAEHLVGKKATKGLLCYMLTPHKSSRSGVQGAGRSPQHVTTKAPENLDSQSLLQTPEHPQFTLLVQLLTC